MKKAVFVIAIAILAACGTTKLLTPTQLDVDRGAKKYQGLTLTDLNQGKMIYEKSCGNCHGLKKAESENESEWTRIVPDMVKKTNKKAGKEEINSDQQQLLLKYLITMSEVKKATN